MDVNIRGKSKSLLKLRNLRLSLKYRPEIFKLILKMRLCLRKKNFIITRLKKQLKLLMNNKVTSSLVQTDDIILEFSNGESDPTSIIDNDKILSDVSTQTSKLQIKETKEETNSEENLESKLSEWKLQDEEDKGKSIADQVKEAAQSALNENGMVFVESAGMYYDYKTGYYYNSELGLYYHTDTGCYYSYSDEKKNFVFHSYPDRSAEIENAPLFKHVLKKAKKHKKERSNIDNLTKKLSQDKEDDEVSKPKRKKIMKTKKKEVNKDVEKPVMNIEDIEKENMLDDGEDSQKEVKDELEDGECSETDCEELSEVDDVESIISTSTATDDDDSIAKHHPPCMRLVVRETNVNKLKVGSLFVITKDGGSIGREGDQHAIVIKDNNVSRNHLDIRYNLENKVYMATDLGSKNGTILNGNRMSESQDISTPMEVLHGSTLQLGDTKLLCHIHSGNETCGHCEPGLLIDSEDKERKVAYTRTCSVQKQHQLELARLKNKYAKPPLAIESEAYNDRAQARRTAVGSSHSAEKTQSSDINTFIPSENKGFKLLEKMGWSKGEGLGKDSQGDKEPGHNKTICFLPACEPRAHVTCARGCNQGGLAIIAANNCSADISRF
ncbi:PREDICTED: angiogenic factor with G patch and FHA domains 1 isoform X2 [Papilio polytes]|uniref:angiogenic factor with G patch and FHA domains 1 isoform X2 n=1 Tax=Papilio polytes TaxID=76194 RepID=UPI00067618AC|nr:PREDICTED: angiogenic factor with G patch and FHA domains 1 isoform X2 [Papilio polytes]